MTGTQLVAGAIEQHIPDLVSGAAVVALVPATDLKGWAAEMAWRVARSAAAGGRRTALVDCFVDAPTLHGVAGAGNREGLVDAFEYGASLNRIVQEQPQANLFFIAAGTFAAEPEELMTHPRWRRLSAGFRHEEALLLLYVDAAHVGRLAAEPDGMIVLAPQGFDLAVADAPAVAEAVGRGMRLIAVVAEEEEAGSGEREAAGERTEAPGDRGAEGQEGLLEPAIAIAPTAAQDVPESAGSPIPAPGSARRSGSKPMAMLVETSRQRSLVPWLVVGLALLAAGAGWILRGRIAALASSRGTAAPRASSGSAASTAATPAPSPPAAPAAPPVESLPWAVEVTVLLTLSDALTSADSLESHGVPAMVAPLRPRGARPSYRVYAGPYASRSRADSVLGALRTAGAVARRAGQVDSVPLSMALAGGLTRGAALAERARLREAGVPTFVLGQAGGTFRLYAGAYAGAVQTVLLQDLLTPTGGAGALLPRAGYVP